MRGLKDPRPARASGQRARREVLISVAGLTPQVITETLYCLMGTRRRVADISEIWVITTEDGKRELEKSLLDPRHGRFFAFCRDYRIAGDRVRFDRAHVLVIRDTQGRPLADIRTPSDSAAAADFILDVVRRQAADPERVLHCSVAGGRKTMGLYLGLALQLYGRPGDTLSHVLVSPAEVESDPAFYYPPPRPGWVRVRGGRVHTRGIKVELAGMPLLFLREKLPVLNQQERSYTDLVRRAQEDYALLAAPPPAALEPGARSLVVAGRRVRLSGLETALYLVFARSRRDTCGRAGCGGCDRCTLAASDFLGKEGVARLHEALTRVGGRDARLDELRGWATDDPLDAEKRFREVRSRMNRKIQQGLGGEAWPALYTVAALRLSGEDRTRYGIRLDPRLLTIG